MCSSVCLGSDLSAVLSSFRVRGTVVVGIAHRSLRSDPVPVFVFTTAVCAFRCFFGTHVMPQ